MSKKKKVEFLSVDTHSGESNLSTLRVNNIDPHEIMMEQFKQNCGTMGNIMGALEDKAMHPTLIYWGEQDHPLVRGKEYVLTYWDNVLHCYVTGIVTIKDRK